MRKISQRSRIFQDFNEGIANDGTIARDNFWYHGIGPDYIEMAFQLAHAADPNVLLFYNDGYPEDTGGKSDGVFTLVTTLLSDVMPLFSGVYRMPNPEYPISIQIGGLH